MAAMTLDDLVGQLRAAHGDNLVSVVLYGSAAADQHIPTKSDYNVLVLVRSLSLERLDAQSAIARAWGEAGNPPPLTLTDEEWRSSADIFPMEYADILERHRVLHGSPPFEGIAVEPSNLRLQLELEAMGKLIQFRQAVLAAGNDQKRQLQLLERSISTVMVIFRSVERLAGVRPDADNARLAEAVGTRAGFDPRPFVRVTEHRRGKLALQLPETRGVLEGYLAGMTRLVRYLNDA